MTRILSGSFAFLVIGLVGTHAAAATSTWDDGQTHVVSSDTSDAFSASGGPGSQVTTLPLVTGANDNRVITAGVHRHVAVRVGQKTGTRLILFGDSTAAYRGGFIPTSVVQRNACLQIAGSTINQIEANHDAVVDIYVETFQNSGAFASLCLLNDRVLSVHGESLMLVDAALTTFTATTGCSSI